MWKLLSARKSPIPTAGWKKTFATARKWPAWVERQNAVTDAYLEALPARDWFANRIGELYDFERFSVPVERGRPLFLHRQFRPAEPVAAVCARQPGCRAAPADRSQRMGRGWRHRASGWVPSPDGSKLLYSVQDGGSDWRILRVMDVATGEQIGGEIRWAKFTSLSWVGEDGFLYSRFPGAGGGRGLPGAQHEPGGLLPRAGHEQVDDQLVFATPDHPERNHTAQTTSDGRWALVTSSTGTDSRYEVNLIDLDARDGTARVLVPGFENSWSLIDSVGSRLFFTTNDDAPLYRVVSIDMDDPQAGWTEVIAEKRAADRRCLAGWRAPGAGISRGCLVRGLHLHAGRRSGARNGIRRARQRRRFLWRS